MRRSRGLRRALRVGFRRAAWPALLCLGAALCASPASAGLKLCNQTSYILYAAVGTQRGTVIATRGWTRILPGDCSGVVAEPLTAAAYFVYARSAKFPGQPVRSWSGQFQLCVKDGDFALEMPASAADCGPKGAEPAPFAPVETGGQRAWTMTFTETPALAAPEAAQRAGLARLAAVLGYRTDGKNLDGALAAFRARVRLPARAGSADLFAALETAAAQAAPSSGYRICNEGSAEIWAALGVRQGNDYVSRGWWDIAAGRCVMAIMAALDRGAVYLYASKQGNNHLVSGPAGFCISNAAFELHGRERCAARGLSAAGFLPTNLKGLPGFTAHIGDSGLGSLQAPTPK